jgi:hypothetical protein
MTSARWLLAGVLLVAASATGSEAARARAARPDSGSISGTVIDDESRQPLAGVTVTASIDGVVAATTMSASEGGFAFASLPRGRVTIAARKDPYVQPPWQVGQPPSTYWIADGVRIGDVLVRMRRGGVVEGMVTGASASALAAARVTALQCSSFGDACGASKEGGTAKEGRVFRPGQLPVVAGRSTTTDASGRYRLFGLPAGRYLVLVDAGRNRASDPLAYVPTYFGGVTDPSRATVVEVEPGSERAGVDVQLQTAQTASISGVVRGVDGAPAQVRDVSIFPAGLSMSISSMGAVAVRADGSFSTPALAPGRYRLLARAAASDQAQPAAEAIVDLAGAGVTDVTMSLGAASISGRVVLDGEVSVGAKPAVRVELRRADAGVVVSSYDVKSADAGPDGGFRIDGLLPGRYELAVTATSAGAARWWAESAPVPGGDALDSGVVVAAGGMPELIVQVTRSPARISGVVEHYDGRPASEFSIAVFPVEDSGRGPRSRRIRLNAIAADGSFDVAGLPPGDYYVAAVGTSDPRELGAESLRQFESAAHRVSLGRGQQVEVRFRLPPFSR